MTIQKFKEKFGKHFPKDGYDAVYCAKCGKDMSFYQDIEDRPFYGISQGPDEFVNNAWDAVYCCNHCSKLMFEDDCQKESFKNIDEYIKRSKKTIRSLVNEKNKHSKY